MNSDNLFMFQLHLGSLKQVFRTGGKINEQTLTLFGSGEEGGGGGGAKWPVARFFLYSSETV